MAASDLLPQDVFDSALAGNEYAQALLDAYDTYVVERTGEAWYWFLYFLREYQSRPA